VLEYLAGDGPGHKDPDWLQFLINCAVPLEGETHPDNTYVTLIIPGTRCDLFVSGAVLPDRASDRRKYYNMLTDDPKMG